MAHGTARCAGKVVSRLLPLGLRKSMLTSRVCPASRAGIDFSIGMLDDLRRRDPSAFHRFLWSNHLAYATSYEIERRFGEEKLNPSRGILFDEIARHLRGCGVDPRVKIRSIFEVGCSMGYLLRHLEVQIYPEADVLHGLDIDGYAIETGMQHLRSLQSKVRLFASDLADAPRIMGDRRYDLVLCCGVLMYVNQAAAEELVGTMLARAGCLGILCLAPTREDGDLSGESALRPDGAFLHDVNGMIGRAGGKVVCSRWIGSTVSGSSPSYAILAEPVVSRASLS
jgi:SAM-dependent methyltransferase